MKHEFEARFLDIDIEDIKKKAGEIGASLVKPRTLYRRYTFDTDTLKAQRGFLRLRDEGGKSTLTVKITAHEDSIDGTKEAEIEVSDFDTTKEILGLMGVQPRNYQETYREKWEIGEVVLDIDEWPKIKPHLEIEGPSEEAVREVAGKLGLDYSQASFDSIDTIFQKATGEDIKTIESLTF